MTHTGGIDTARTADGYQVVVRDVHKRYGMRRVLRGVNLTVSGGQCLCLLGSNGAGKSTLIRCLVRLIRPDEGSVHMTSASVSPAQLDQAAGYICSPAKVHDRGQPACPADRYRSTAKRLHRPAHPVQAEGGLCTPDMAHDHERYGTTDQHRWTKPRGTSVRLQRYTTAGSTVLQQSGYTAMRLHCEVGYLGHDPLVYDTLTVDENLRLFAGLYGVADPAGRAAEVAGEFSLDVFADTPAGALSRGLMQRLALARACVHDPGVLVLDEPFTGLDQPSQRVLVDRIRRWTTQGRAVIASSHQVSAVWGCATHVAVLDGGRIIMHAACDQVDRRAFEDDYRAYAAHIGQK